MNRQRLLSLLLSLCLHAGVIMLALFWPVSAPPMVDLGPTAIDVEFYYYAPGSPGGPPAPVPAPTPPQPAPPAPVPDPTPPPALPTPQPDPVPLPVPDVEPVPIPQPDKPVEPPKPEEPPTPADPPKPEEQPAPEEQPKPKDPPKQPQPDRNAVRNALRDLGTSQPGQGSIGDALESLRNNTPGDGGEGGTSGRVRGTYMQSLVSRIKPNWEYVGRADRRNPTAVVEIHIAQDGTIMERAIVESSGDAAFDGSVLKAVDDTLRVEPPPTPDLARVRVPFAYEAIRR